MDSTEFRTIMTDRIRAFDNWAWRDSLENPSEYSEMNFDAWLTLFEQFVENQQ